MKLIFPEVPGWVFVVEEVSACVYQVTAYDTENHMFVKSGVDYDALIAEAKHYASTFVKI